jgi:hypothetical protein
MVTGAVVLAVFRMGVAVAGAVVFCATTCDLVDSEFLILDIPSEKAAISTNPKISPGKKGLSCAISYTLLVNYLSKVHLYFLKHRELYKEAGAATKWYFWVSLYYSRTEKISPRNPK